MSAEPVATNLDYADPDVRILHGDALQRLAELPSESVQCIITSPPFWGLRDYGTGTWTGGDEACDHTDAAPSAEHAANRERAAAYKAAGCSTGQHGGWEGRATRSDGSRTCRCGAVRTDQQIGLEETPSEWCDRLVAVFRECRRVLRDDGVMFVEIGDSYATGTRADRQPTETAIHGHWQRDANPTRLDAPGLKPKDLVGAPWMLAFALRADGWFLRSDCIWARPNPMPESVTDRPTKAHSYVFLLTKRGTYYYDADAIREPHQRDGRRITTVQQAGGSLQHRDGERWPGAGANTRTVWSIPTEPTPFAHFACVDDQTEALTQKGWRRHDELVDGDTIASYDQATGTIRFLQATFHRYPYSDDLVAIRKRDTSQLLTPNHRCVVKRRDGDEEVVEARALIPSMSVRVAAPFERFGDVGPTLGPLAALAGWYIAEGWSRSANTIGISQSITANPQHVQQIRRLLVELNADHIERTREREWNGRAAVDVEWVVRGAVAAKLRELAPSKAMTPRLASLAPADARLLLDALIDGDGHRRIDGRCCIVQKDRDSIDLMQILALRLGYRAHVRPRPDGWVLNLTTDGEWLTLRGTNGTHEPIPTERYEGVVWCPNTPTGFWLARRNGMPFVTGNTFPQTLVEKCLKAGTSEHGACSACGTPWKRIVKRTPMDVTPTAKRAAWQATDDHARTQVGGTMTKPPTSETTGWEASCTCNASVVPCVCLDPFMGSGTVGIVARRLGRHAIGVELNSEYIAIAARRLAQQSLLA